MGFALTTQRLTLRPWQAQDLEPFYRLNNDPQVMQYLPEPLSRQASDNLAAKLNQHIQELGWGTWAVEENHSKAFIGFVGLNIPESQLPLSPCVELAWRLATEYWGQGYATEAAKTSLHVAFNDLKLDQVVASTSVINRRSAAVMQRLGMVNNQPNFYHPLIPQSNPLSEHLLYTITRSQWLTK